MAFRVQTKRLYATTILATGWHFIWLGGAFALQSSTEFSIGSRPELREGAEEEVLFEADNVFRDDETGPIVAEGNVRAYFGERFLRSDRLTYNPDTDVVVAEGDVSITDEKLETVFAGRVQLTGDLRDGVATNFSSLLAENARIAADNAVREQGARTRLRKAVYTACNVCNDEGDGKIPTWRVKSLRVVRDEERKVLRFHHAFIELKGVPILYTPIIQGPDPSVERQSGFLSPRVGSTSRQGFNFELPYYFAISNSQDATFFPRYTARDGVLWQAEYRRRDDNGYQVISGSVIDFDNQIVNPNDLSDPENDPDAPGVRWHIFANGHRNFGENLTIGYDVERSSDDTFLRRYRLLRRGDLRKEVDTSQSNRLLTNTYAKWEKNGHKLRADSFLFQELRTPSNIVGEGAPGFLDDDRVDDLVPYVLPTIDYEKRGWKVAGGEIGLRSNLAVIQRREGLDSRRLSTSVSWEREHITKSGHRFKAFAELRGDAYYYQDLDQGTLTTRGLAIGEATPEDNDSFESRFAPTVALEWSYPLTKRVNYASFFIEPRAQFVATLDDVNDQGIINEDSRSIEFDYAGLFDYNKSSGFDVIEDGQRFNVGLAASAKFDLGLNVETEIGQQFRLNTSNAFSFNDVPTVAQLSGLEPPGSSTLDDNGPTNVFGLGGTRSDIVGSLNISYRNFIGIQNQFRFSNDFGALPRAESIGFLSLWRLRGNVSYVRLNDGLDGVSSARREELKPNFLFQLSDNWRAGFGWRQNLATNELVTQDFSLAYQDDCSLFEFTYRRDRTTDRGLERDNTFFVRFTLKTLVD